MKLTSDSLSLMISHYLGIELRNIQYLLAVLRKSKLRNRAYVRQQFLDGGTQFDETISFLVKLGVVSATENELLLIEESWLPDHVKGNALIERILARRGPLRSEMVAYLRHYKVKDGSVTFSPSDEERSEQVGVRNLLMELELVTYDESNRHYQLDTAYSQLLLVALRRESPTSPDQIQVAVSAQHDLGAYVESWVVEYERRRVGENWSHRVEHVALDDASAGYDIRSVTVLSQCELFPRLIEVKGVSANNLCFYWSANEVRVAETLGSWYWLYLVPIDSAGECDVTQLRMINDPVQKILCSPDEWDTETDVFKCCHKAS